MLPELLVDHPPRSPQDDGWTAFSDPLVRQAYAVGCALQEVGKEPGLEANERLVALAMYLDAVNNDTLPDLPQVIAMCQLSEAVIIKAIQKLSVAGFIKVVRAREGLLYEVQFPSGCDF